MSLKTGSMGVNKSQLKDMHRYSVKPLLKITGIKSLMLCNYTFFIFILQADLRKKMAEEKHNSLGGNGYKNEKLFNGECAKTE